MNDTFKICPSVEELSSVSSTVQCSQDGCKATFRCSSNLNMHLLKRHKIGTGGLSKKSRTYEYYCPIKTCLYHRDSKKCFEKLKYLKQHFLKVHAAKKYECRICCKRFSTEAFRNIHARGCGKFFPCSCGATYNSWEAVLTHSKRKGAGHAAVKPIPPDTLVEKEENQSEIPESKFKRLIYPKPPNDSVPFPVHYIAAIALSELSIPSRLSKAKHVAVQTDGRDSSAASGTKVTHFLKSENKKRKSSRQTQTTVGRNKNLKISAETQTIGDYLKQKLKHHQRLTSKKRKKSMETQTKDQSKTPLIPYKNFKSGKGKSVGVLDDGSESTRSAVASASDDKWFWNGRTDGKEANSESAPEVPSQMEANSKSGSLEAFPKKDFQYNDSFENKNCVFYAGHSGADQQMFDYNRLCNIETQTEVDSFLTECSEDTSFTLCSTTETQTTDDFESLLYSNMCTQTSEDVDQLFDFNFVDIETQTAWPDLSD